MFAPLLLLLFAPITKGSVATSESSLGPEALLLNDTSNSSEPDPKANATQFEQLLNALPYQYTRKYENYTKATTRRKAFRRICGYLNHLDRNLTDDQCPYVFDGYTCWRPAQPEETVRMPCPTYMSTDPPKDVFVTIQCGSDGSWNLADDHKLQYEECNFAKFKDDRFIFKLIKVGNVCKTVGYIVSILALIVAVAIFTYFRKLHCARNFIHLNLFASFLLRGFMSVLQFFLSSALSKANSEGQTKIIPSNSNDSIIEEFENTVAPLHWDCKLFAVLWNYVIIANMFWLLVEGLYLHNLLYRTVLKEPQVTKYVIFGWLTPAFVMIPWVIVKAIYDDYGCWIRYGDTKYMWVLMVPILIAIAVNFALFVKIVRQLYLKLKTDAQLTDKKRYKKLAKSTLILMAILGSFYFITAITVLVVSKANPHDLKLAPIVVHVIEILLSSLLGFVVSIVYCFANQEVRSLVAKRWKQWIYTRQYSSNNNTEKATTGTKPVKKRNRCNSLRNFSATNNDNINILTDKEKRHCRSCADCQIRLHLIETRVPLAHGQPENEQRANNNNMYDSDEPNTQCSTVANSAQSSLNRVAGMKLRRAMVSAERAVAHSRQLSKCWEEAENSSDTHSRSPNPPSSERFHSCEERRLPCTCGEDSDLFGASEFESCDSDNKRAEYAL